jgi:phosphatidate cytidylyltransferase
MELSQLLTGTFVALVVGTIAGQMLKWRAGSDSDRQTVANINQRIASWWVLCIAAALALVTGAGGVCALFIALSGLAMNELAPWTFASGSIRVFFAVMQFVLVARHQDAAALFVMPVGALLAIPVANVLAGVEPFLETTALQYWSLMLTVYCLSFVPALLNLPIRAFEGRNPTVLYYLLLVTQSSDILQYLWGKLFGRRPIAPRISPNKTWAGFLGGIMSATALGTVLYRATPFRPWQAAVICLAITLAGFCGGLVMSAIKRQRGVKDYGNLVPGHGGVLDRVDSLCFAAPVFYWLVRYFFADAP